MIIPYDSSTVLLFGPVSGCLNNLEQLAGPEGRGATPHNPFSIHKALWAPAWWFSLSVHSSSRSESLWRHLSCRLLCLACVLERRYPELGSRSPVRREYSPRNQQCVTTEPGKVTKLQSIIKYFKNKNNNWNCRVIRFTCVILSLLPSQLSLSSYRGSLLVPM